MLLGEVENGVQDGCWKDSGKVALCGISGSLLREVLRNLASRLSCGLNSLCLGTRTGGRTRNK